MRFIITPLETVEEKQLNKKDVGKRTHDVEIDEAQVTEPIAGDNNLVSIPEPEKEAEVSVGQVEDEEDASHLAKEGNGSSQVTQGKDDEREGREESEDVNQ